MSYILWYQKWIDESDLYCHTGASIELSNIPKLNWFILSSNFYPQYTRINACQIQWHHHFLIEFDINLAIFKDLCYLCFYVRIAEFFYWCYICG